MTRPMPIFRALGLGIFLLVTSLIVPSVFSQLQKTAIAFLHAGEVSADTASSIAGSAASIPLSHDPLRLPAARPIASP